MWTRREWIGNAAGASLLPWTGLTTGCSSPNAGVANNAQGEFEPDVVIKLSATITYASIWAGKKTHLLKFVGEVVEGRKSALRDSGSFLGPTLDFVQGEKIRILFENKLLEPTIVHWHGMIVPEAADGHPLLAVPKGGSYTYEFQVTNNPGTYWYHPHPHGRTGFQVYFGLAGALIVRDPNEANLGLPQGDDEHLLVIQDRRADNNNQFQYMKSMMERMTGALGDRILINGQADKAIKVSRKPNRLRLLNLSNARPYKLAWSDGSPMHVIGTDGGLLAGDEGPKTMPYVLLAPAERIEVWKDFSNADAGADVTLVSEEFSMPMGMNMGGGRPQMMRGGGMGGGPGQKMTIAKFSVADQPAVSGKLPVLPGKKLILPAATREIETQLGFRMMRGFLNGKQWNMKDMTHVAENEILKRNESVIWTFDNTKSPGMSMPHPMHLHGVQFRILERKGDGAGDLAQGIVDAGDNDTVMVFANQVVKIQVKPTVEGLFVYHCHNLEHEDNGMMRNFRVDA